MADAKLTALTAASALAGADLFYVSQSAASRKATGTQLLTLVGTTYVPLAGNATMTGALTIASGTLTASAPAVAITQTWNQGATDFIASSISVTGTSHGFGSRLFQASFDADAKFVVGYNGFVWASNSLGLVAGTYGFWHPAGLQFPDTAYLGWASATNATGTIDAKLYRDAAATLAQRNGTTQQIFRLYNSYTDSSNFERLTLTGVAGTSVNITAETLGTGGDNLDIVLTPAGTGNVKFGTHSAIAAETVTGYITIKDAGGTTRKLAVVS